MTTVRDFGAKGDGKTDDTAALSHAVQRGGGELVFPRGDYVLSKPLYIPLELHGRLSIRGEGGTARLIMKGPGPALLLVGTHRKSALPAHFTEEVWTKERMPTVTGLEIVGGHARADGIRIEGVMQPTITRVLIRRCRHGIHLTSRDRNVLIADCHIYDNSGIGIYLEKVNLHQVNIHGNHISYCKQGGLRIEGSEVRNIQVCSNDIEYNHDLEAKTSADILYDCRQGTVREGTIVGNTIQAVKSPGGANVRLLGIGKDNPNAVGLLSITGNLIGSQETALHLVACRGVTVSGNCIYSGYHYALLAEDAEHLVVSGNSIDHNPDYKGKSTDQMVFRGCRNVNLSGLLLQHSREPDLKVDTSILMEDCRNVSVTGCQVMGARVRGIDVKGGSVVRVADCTIRPHEGDKSFRAAIRVANCEPVMVVNNFVGKGSDGALILPNETSSSGNVTV
jgi:polygalacturonase